MPRFTYLINDTKEVFEDYDSLIARLKKADEMGWSVKELTEGEDEKVEDSTDVSRAPAEESMIEKIDSPNFGEDLATSASEGSDVFAQPELESSSEDTSLDLPAVTIDDIESEAEKNEVINLEALQGLLGGDEDRVKEAMQAIARTPNMSLNITDYNQKEKTSSRNATLSYTNPDTGDIDETFDLRIQGRDLSKTEMSEKAKELRKFLNRYADSNALTAMGDQAETMLGSANLNPTEQEITEALPPKESMFEPQTKQRFTQKNKYSSTGEIEEFDVYPYDAELEAKRNQLISEGSDLGVDELIAKSKDMVYADLKEAKRQELLTQKTEQYLSDNIDKRSIATLGGAVAKTKKFKAWAAKEAVVIANTNSSVAKTKNLALASRYAEGTVQAAELKINGQTVMLGDLSDGSPVLTYETGVQITQQQKDILDGEQVELNASLEAFAPLMQDLNETGKKLGDMDAQLKAAGLNFSILDKSASTLVTGLGSIGVSLGMFGIKTINLMNYGSEVLTGQVGAENRFLRTEEALDEWGSQYSEFKEDIRGQYVRDLSVGEGFSSGKNFAKFVAQEIATQAPVLIAMAASGGTLAPYIVGAWTAGEKMMDIAYENSLMTSSERTGAFEAYAKAIGVGLANGVFTGLTTNPILQNGMKMFKGNTKKDFLLNLNDYWKLNWKRNLVYDNALELSGELATNVVENAIDGRPIFENADHVAVSSLGFSFAFSGLPFLQGAGIRALSPRKTTIDLDNRQKKIFDLEAAYAAVDKRTVAGKEIRTQLEALKVVQGREIAKAEQKAQNGISILGARGVQATTKTINEAKEKASNIVNDPTLTYKQKEAALEKIQNDFIVAKSTQEAYLSSAFRDEFILLEATDPDGYQGYMDQAMNELNAYVVTDQVKQKASDLYNAKLIRDKFAVNGKKVNSRAMLFETTKEAIAEVEKMAKAGEITPEEKADIIANLKKGAGGVNIKIGKTDKNGEFTYSLDADGDSVTTPIAIIESQLAEQKIGVMEHELSHGVMDKIFANAPEKLAAMADQIELWMQKNQAGLNLKIQNQLSPYMVDYTKRIDKAATKEEKLSLEKELQSIIANEYMANFFELVGGGKGMDPLAPGNQAFMGLSGYMLQDLAGKDYNFDFRGPDDFVAFAASIAKGIKEGTVNINRLGDLKKQVDKIAADKTDGKAATPATRLSKPLQDKFDEAEEALNDAEDMFNLDPDNPTLQKAVEDAQKTYDLAEAALDEGVDAVPKATAATNEPVKKEKIVRPKADKSKRKYSLDTEVKKEIEPKIAEVQAINKVIKEEEKRLNAEAKKAIEDKPETGDVTRTSKEEELVALKENPITINANNSPDIIKQAARRDKLQNEIVKALDVPLSKAARLFTNVFYNKISENAKQATSREDYLASAKANLTVMTINEFKPETINRKGENVINDIEDIIFQRGGLRAVKFAEDLGVVGKDQGTSRGAEALVKMASNDTEFEFETKDSKKPGKKLVSGFKGEIRRPSALLANETLKAQAKAKILEFWEKNRGNKKVENFKNLPVVIDSILAEIYGISEGTLTARSGNFNKETYKSAITAFTAKQAVFRTEVNGEMTEVRVPYDQRDSKLAELEAKAKEDSNFTFEEYSPESRAEGILRFLPELSVPEYQYFSGKRGRSAGMSTGMPRSFTKLAYLVTGRRTQAQGNLEGEIQKISRDELLEAIGAIDDGNGNAVPDVAKAREAGKAINKMPGAQTLLSLIKLEGRMIANEMSREFGNLDPMTLLDIEMGKNPTMYSKSITNFGGVEAMLNMANVNYDSATNAQLSVEVLNHLKGKFAKYPISAADVFKATDTYLRKEFDVQVGRIFADEVFNDFIGKTDLTPDQTKKLINSSYGKALGTAFDYILRDRGYNKLTAALKALGDKLSTADIVEFIEFYGRGIRDAKVDGIITNKDLYNSLAEKLGITPKELKTKYGVELAKETRYRVKKKGEKATEQEVFVIKKPGSDNKLKGIFKTTTIEDIKKVRTQSNERIDGMAATMASDTKKNRDFVKKIVTDSKQAYLAAGKNKVKQQEIFLEAKAKLLLLSGGQLTPMRKMYNLKNVYKTKAASMLEHEISLGVMRQALYDYISAKKNFDIDAYFSELYVNIIPVEANAVLDRDGDSTRYDKEPDGKGKGGFKNKVKGLKFYNAQEKRQRTADNNFYSLPLNLRQKGLTVEQSLKAVENFDKAINLGNSLDRPRRGISVWDFDDTLATTKSNVLYTMPDGTKGKLDASRFAKEGDTFLANGAEFDFSEFSKVMSGAKGPFFNKAVDRNKKFGNKDVYILTARPANSANAIHEFLKGIGLDIPLANITGLASSDPQAKANWVVGKFAEGYNDFYFADDHVGNVAAVGDALSRLDDVQSKVELAKATRYSKKIRAEYSTILDKLRGGDVIEGNKVFSAEQQIDDVFDWVKSLDIPEKNQAKYKKAALNFVAKSPTNFPVDAEIVGEAIRIAELKKLNVMDFSNPRDIIDKFAGEVKAKRLDPNKEKQFFNKKSLPEGVETFQIMPTRRGQQAVRRILDTHWGKKTNPWCVTAQKNAYTPAEQKERKENPPGIPIGTTVKVTYEAIVNAGVVEDYITFDNLGNRVEDVMFDFIGNLKPGWVAGKAEYDSTDKNDQWVIDRDNEQDFNEDLATAKAEGYTIREGSYDTSQDNFYVQMERNNNPEVNRVQKYVAYYKTKDPNMTQKEFDNGPAKGGTVTNPEIEATGPIKLTPGSFRMWENYGKPINTEMVNEDTGAVEFDDGGFEIAFKDGKLLGLKNLGASKQQWFDRMDHGTKDLALKVPRDPKGKINGSSNMMNTDSGRVFSKDYTVKYSKKLEGEINFLTNELSTKGEALPGQTLNADQQPKAVKDVINTLDVKSKTQQSRIRYSKALDEEFNKIIEQESGIEAFKEYKSVKAALKGKVKKFRMKFFIPPSAEDFLGLLYTTLPKGKQGEAALAFYTEHLLQPYARAINGLRKGRIAMAKDYKAVKKQLGIVPKELKKTFEYEDENGKMKESLFSKEMAIRVYVWDAQGIEVEGLSNVDLPILVNYVNANPDLKAFGDQLLALNKGKKSATPNENWPAGTITSDLLNDLNTEGRKGLLELWQQNVDVIFSSKNMSKLEAAYGENYVVAVKDALRRMKSGRNTVPTPNTVTDTFVRWLNGAVGNIMFLNRRSAVLQLISFTNFINFEGNNIYQASKAFANQPQYWKDWIYLMNSDYLVDRRDGLRINVNEADIATTAKEGGFQGVLAKILKAGFLPTKMADSAAIATGGASFYRNRVNSLIKDGMDPVAAEKQAMEDFIATAEVSQQSSDPSKSSKQQAEPIGRIILAFANTPSQYARIMKRSAQDLYNGRGKPATHISRLVYYGVIQNAVFNYLQQAMFAAMFGDDDESDEEMTEVQEASNDKKLLSVANSMTDGILRGIGVAGVIFSVLKNLGIKIYQKSDKKRNKNYKMTIYEELLKMSPPLSSKLTKLGKAGSTIEWGQKEIEFDKMSLKHPYVTAAASAIAGATSLPVDRAVGMAIDAADVASADTEAWMKPLIIIGWPKWQLESEATKAATKEAEKERFKELEEQRDFDKLNPTEKRRKVFSDLSKEEQVNLLKKGGLSRRQVSRLTKEADRVDKLMDLQNKKQFNKDMEAISQGKDIEEPKIERPKKAESKYSKEMQKRMKSLEDLDKFEQVDLLRKLGLTRKQAGRLKSEKSRVLEIIKLQDKKRKNSLK